MKNTIAQFILFLIICSLTLQLVGTPMLVSAQDSGTEGTTPAGTGTPTETTTSTGEGAPTSGAPTDGNTTGTTPTGGTPTDDNTTGTTPTGGTPIVTPAPSKLNVGQYLIAEGQVKPSSIGQYIVRVINFLTLAIGSFAFLAIVIGGVILLISTGNESLLQRGKDIIKFAVIGLIVALAAYFITAFVQSIFYEYAN
jgi:hypothetical protein